MILSDCIKLNQLTRYRRNLYANRIWFYEVYLITFIFMIFVKGMATFPRVHLTLCVRSSLFFTKRSLFDLNSKFRDISFLISDHLQLLGMDCLPIWTSAHKLSLDQNWSQEACSLFQGAALIRTKFGQILATKVSIENRVKRQHWVSTSMRHVEEISVRTRYILGLFKSRLI